MSVLPSQDGSPPLSTDSGSDYYSDESSRASPQSDNDKCQHPPPSSSTDHASNSGLPDLPWIPSSALTSPDHYGGLNPENLATLSVINTVTIPDPKLRMSRLQYLGSSSSKTRMDTLLSHQPMQGSQNPSLSPCPNTIRNGLEGGTLEHIPFDEPLCLGNDHDPTRPGPGISRLLTLPSELIDAVFAFLSPYDIASMSAVCHQLRNNALADIHWQAIIQDHVPGCRVRRPYPCRSFKELFAAHDGMWFLPKFKIWFCDWDMPGSVILCRYDQRRGCIEGVRLVAVARNVAYSRWAENEDVVIHTFTPAVSLHLESPVLQLNAGDALALTASSVDHGEPSSRFSKKILMPLGDGFIYSKFALTRPLDDETAQMKLLEDHPYGSIWPPPTIPAHHYVSGSGCDRAYDYPAHRSEVSDQTFRIWRGIGRNRNFHASSFPLNPTLQGPGLPGPTQASVLTSERNMTYSTLDPVLYTPTPTKPWRGIWVGDYTGHGCEFLLIHQPDDPPATDAELNLVRSAAETDEEWQRRQLEARIYRGRLEAIKLTGDANVPRGECSFIAHNLGPDGLAGVAEMPPFTGARMVHSSGHVAATGFQDNKFIESHLFLLSENRLAQYWIEFGFITFFERVNIDDFLDPEARL